MSREIKKIPKRGEIWLVDYNYKPKKGEEKELEIASRIKKFRPSLVVSNNIQNEFDDFVTVAMMTTEDLENIQLFEVFIENTLETGLDEPSKIMLNHPFTVFKELRLEKRLGMASREIMEKAKKAWETSFNTENW